MYTGTFIRIDDGGHAWLRLYFDNSDPDEATEPVYEVLDELPLGDIQGSLNPLVCLLDAAEAELTKLANRWSRNHAEDYHDRIGDLINEMTADYWKSAAPLNV